MQARKTLIVFTVAAVALAGSLFAQGRSGFGRPGQRSANAGAIQRSAGPGQFGGPQGGPGGARMQAIVKFLVAEYLGLTDQQKEALIEAKRAAMESGQELRQQVRENMLAIREAARNGESVDALAEEQGRLVAEAIKQHVATRQSIKAALNLTPEQEEKIERIFELFEQMRPEPGQFAPPEGIEALQ